MIEDEERLTGKPVFSDETTFHWSGKVNRRNK
jgi:hypothetical protein